MRRIAALLIGAWLAACGADVPPPDGSGDPAVKKAARRNQPPEIVYAHLAPDEPSREETIRVQLETRDPDRDTLQVQVTWMRNGSVFRSGQNKILSAAELATGDQIYARVRVTDGQFEDVAETQRVRIRNLPPRVTSLRIEPQEVTANDSLLAIVEAMDPEEEEVRYRFRWFRNGGEVPEETGSSLAPGVAHRGDSVEVAVVPVDDSGNQGDEVRSARIRVHNAPPVITSEPPFTLASPSYYEYQVRAEDPDDDLPLRFELAEGPRGMKIDIVTGRLFWDISRTATGQHDVEVVARDPYGGESRQRYSLDVRLELPPAATP